MQRLKKFNHGVSTLPEKINQKLVDECKARFFGKNKGLINIFKPINNSWFKPIIGALNDTICNIKSCYSRRNSS